MEILKKIGTDHKQVLKIAGLLVLVVIVIALVVQLMGASFRSVVSPRMPSVGYGQATDAAYGYAYEESVKGYGAVTAPSLSYRNVLPIPSPRPSGTPGDDAEEFEVTEYSASIESGDLSETCGSITSLKSLDYVIFENSNETDRNCHYTFKVKHAKVAEILEKIKALNPRDLAENTYTIKNQIEDFTSETDILTKKLASIDETLKSAITAYDQITALAVRTQDADALAKIIDSKLQLIERLTQERLTVSGQLDRLTRAKAEQVDRLEYTYFSVNVAKRKFVDGEQLRDSWKDALAAFVRDLNGIIQGLTLNLLLGLLVVLQFLVYFFILLFIVKYVWGYARDMWRRK